MYAFFHSKCPRRNHNTCKNLRKTHGSETKSVTKSEHNRHLEARFPPLNLANWAIKKNNKF